MVEGHHTALVDQQRVTIAHSIGGVGPLCTLVVARAKAVRESGDRAGCKACTLYVEVSRRFGCWMTGEKAIEQCFGSSENLVIRQLMSSTYRKCDALLPSNWVARGQQRE